MERALVTCLTPPGTAALATLALHGPAAWAIVRELWQPALPAEPIPGTFRLGRVGDELGRDEAVLAVKANSVAPILEIHCHGGRQVVLWLQEILTARGAIICSPAEFFRQTGCPDWQVSALQLLTRAPTVRTASILLDQVQGAWARALAELKDHQSQGRTREANELLETLRARIPLGKHLVEPWRVVVAGAVNAGKSSLVNALAGHARSVVSPQPGTTRDVVTTQLALDGWPVELADTAGHRPADDPLEQAGIGRARSAMALADLVLWLVDGSAPPVFPDDISTRVVLVISKLDLPPAWDNSQIECFAKVSAKTGEGIAELCQKIADHLVPNPPPPGAAVPWSEECMAGQ